MKDPRTIVYEKLDKHYRDNPQEFERLFSLMFKEYEEVPLFLDLLACFSGNKNSFGNYALFYARDLIKNKPSTRSVRLDDGA